jgi:D-arginine dehydrogenase
MNEVPCEALPPSPSAVIIGAGIAGLSAAKELAEQGHSGVLVLEADELVASRASATNAAIFQPLEESTNHVWLAARSRALLDARLGTSWLDAQGVALVSATPDPLEELRYNARRFGVFHERWSAVTMQSRLSAVAGGEVHHGLFLPLAGIIDIHAVLRFLERAAVRAGVRIATGKRVLRILTGERGVTGVELHDGTRLHTERVIIAAGAWAGVVGNTTAAALAFTPMRRHLVHLGGAATLRWKHPVVWRLDTPVYFRPESQGVLASPCDETPSSPDAGSETDPAALDMLSTKLAAVAPSLAQGSVKSSWACHRTMSDDRELVVGPDPRVPGLAWIAGLGGRGMTCGVAAGEMLARTLLGLGHPLGRALSPERFL